MQIDMHYSMRLCENNHAIFITGHNILVTHWLSVADQIKRVIWPQRPAFFRPQLSRCVRQRAHLNEWGFDIDAAFFTKQKTVFRLLSE